MSPSAHQPGTAPDLVRNKRGHTITRLPAQSEVQRPQHLARAVRILNSNLQRRDLGPMLVQARRPQRDLPPVGPAHRRLPLTASVKRKLLLDQKTKEHPQPRCRSELIRSNQLTQHVVDAHRGADKLSGLPWINHLCAPQVGAPTPLRSHFPLENGSEGTRASTRPHTGACGGGTSANTPDLPHPRPSRENSHTQSQLLGFKRESRSRTPSTQRRGHLAIGAEYGVSLADRALVHGSVPMHGPRVDTLHSASSRAR